MNIYINVEITSRELDSKLLLAAVAAANGHEVIVSDLESIIKGMNKGILAPGLFHTKSLTPADHKIARYKSIKDKGFIITSSDEEGGLDLDGYEEFYKTRFSDQMIGFASAVFGWGPDDVETLKKKYPNHSSKIFKTGAPRVDLWRSDLSDYWKVPKEMPKKPFLLISSNLAVVNGYKSFYETTKAREALGYFQRSPNLLKREFNRASEGYLKTLFFIEAIEYLANNNNGYDIVLRPHPSEDTEVWKTYLKNIPNVHVIREGSISAWVKNAFVIMHNGCTTAIEATISKKPLITYMPLETMFDNDPPNKLGYRVQSPKELLEKVNSIFNNVQHDQNKNDYEQISEIISKKVYLDNKELAVEKIVKVWNNLENGRLANTSNWTKFHWLLKAIKLRKLPGNIFRGLLKGKLEIYDANNKFPKLDKNDIYARVSKIQKILGIKGLNCKVLSDRTILIQRKNSD
tara:strand:- start:293 stop:1672 length:1380 start_codon:yes stop_codon:yes gene_type:complete